MLYVSRMNCACAVSHHRQYSMLKYLITNPTMTVSLPILETYLILAVDKIDAIETSAIVKVE